MRSEDDKSSNGLQGCFQGNEAETGLPHFIIREISALVDMRGNANVV